MALKTASGKTNQSSLETDDGILSVQILEFKTTLLDVVQELHIRRDAETRYEEQINTLVLEKQELDWQKESVQHQITTLSKQHQEAVDAVKRGLQAQIRGLDEDKGQHQLTAELREKEMTSLKEELKSLQLCKYSMEKKLSELEQKLELQTQSKENHLKQLGEVEQRFGTVSRQCTTLKQAHDRLQQNVEEAVKINKKLTTLNKSQESKICLLTQDVERLHNEVIKARVSSAYQSREEISSLRECERQIQHLQHRLQMEMELNRKLQHENDSVNLEKQGVMNSLQHTQQLLHTQTVALSRSQAELLAQGKEYQALKRQHELVREEAKGKEERFGRLKEECKNDSILWEKEKQVLQQQLQVLQEEHGLVKEAYRDLHEKHKQLSSARLCGPVHGTDGASMLVDGQQPVDAHSTSLSFEEQIDPVSETQSCTQGNPSTYSEPVPDEPDKAEKISTEDSSSGQTLSVHVDTQAAHIDTLSPTHHLDSGGNGQRGPPPDQSGQRGSPIAPLLRTSEAGSAKDGSSGWIQSELTNPNINQAPDLSEHSQLNVDELSKADKSSSNDSSSMGMVQCSDGLSVSETSSVYGAKNDPGAAGKEEREGEVGVQQTLCTPEARHPQSPDKASDGQRVAPALDSASEPQPRPQPQTPNAKVVPESASNFQTADEIRNFVSDPKTDQGSQLGCDESIKVAAPTQVNNNNNNIKTDAPQCAQTPVSQSQEPPGSRSPQSLDQPHVPELAKDLNRQPCVPEPPKDLHSQPRVPEPPEDLIRQPCVPEPPKDLCRQTVEGLPVAVEQNVEAVQWVNPEKPVPAVTADAKCSYVSANMGSPELFPPTSSAAEADPTLVTEEPCSSDGEKHQGHIPADPPVTPPMSAASGETGVGERSTLRAVEPHSGGALGTKLHRASFVWGEALAKSPQLMMSLHGAEGSPGVAQGSAVCTVSAAAPAPAPGPAVSEHRSATPQRRFLEIPSAFSAPIFQRDRLNKRDSAANVRNAGGSEASGVHPGHKRDQQENWNAIRQSLSEMTTGMESRVAIPFSSPASGTVAAAAAASLSGGNGSRQDCPPSRSFTHPHRQSLRMPSQPVDEGRTQSSQAKQERPHIDIRAQIAKTEQFLSAEGVSLPKKSKMEEKEDIEL